MKLAVFSDCHFEFHRDGGRSFISELESVPDVVAVVAGDLAPLPYLTEPLTALCAKFRHVVYVSGNHELYGGRSSDVERCKGAISKSLPNLHWLEREFVEIDDVRFVGTTLWFPLPPLNAPKHALNDYNLIREFEPWVYRESEESSTFLDKTLKSDDILVTHHFPFERSIAREYHGSPLNSFFHAGKQAEAVVMEKKPRLAIHGHTHTSFDYVVGGTRVVCNPHGYPNENPDFDYGKIVEL